MPTGYTAMIKSGEVKTAKEFLHLCLRNFGICISMKDEPLDSRKDYTDNIMKFTQSDVDYYRNALKSAEDHLKKIQQSTEEELYQMYVHAQSETKKWCEKGLQEANEVNAKYNQISDEIKKWDCSPEYENIKNFALDQLKISVEGTDYFKKTLEEIGDLSRESFHEKKNEFLNKLIADDQWTIDYHKKEMESAIERQANALTFYHFFQEEIEKLNK